MKIIHPDFTISDKSAAGLLAGKYVRTGGVIRNRDTGKIVEHLKDISSRDLKGGNQAVAQTAKTTSVVIKKSRTLSLGSKFAVGTLIVVGVAAIGYGSYSLFTYMQKQKEAKQRVDETQKNNDLIEYNPQLTEYFNNMQTKKMKLSSIKKVISFFEKYSKGDLAIEISNEELLVIRNLIVKYTIKLCETNKISIDNYRLTIDAKTIKNEDLLGEIVYATKIQQEIFAK
jgi:hypothetical protein